MFHSSVDYWLEHIPGHKRSDKGCDLRVIHCSDNKERIRDVVSGFVPGTSLNFLSTEHLTYAENGGKPF